MKNTSQHRRLYHTENCSHSSWNIEKNSCDCGWLQDLHENGWPIRESNSTRSEVQVPKTSGVILSEEELQEFLRLLAIRANTIAPAR